MIYRIVVDSRYHTENSEGIKLAIPWEYPEAQRMIGASYGYLCGVMLERELFAPEITNPRARFYFTEEGWKKVGRYVASEAKSLGHVAKIIKRNDVV